MAIHRWGAALLLVACGLASSTPRQLARAATITLVERPECSLRLHGPIAAGDTDALAKLGTSSICLDSDGGDLDEALKMIDFMNAVGHSFVTVVDRNEACRAECAFVFLAGRVTEYHSFTFPARSLHAAGILEFKSPGPAPSGPAASEAIVAAAYAESVASVSRILKREHEHGDPTSNDPIDRNRTFPLSLLLNILSAEPGHPFQVDTIDQAGRWGILLFGLPPIEATDAVLLQACKNESRWGGWLNGGAGDISDETPKMVSRDLMKVSLRGLGAGDPVTCMAARYRDAEGLFTIAVRFSSKGEPDDVPDAVAAAKERKDRGEDSPLDTPLWAGLPPDSRLETLKAK